MPLCRPVLVAILTAVLAVAARTQVDAVRCQPDRMGVKAPERTALPPAVDLPPPPKGSADPTHRHPERRVPIGPDRGTPQPTSPPSFEHSADAIAPAVGAFTFFKNAVCRPTGASLSTTAAVEPSASINRDTVWQTGNWYAAVSRDSGETFTYVNPYTFFPAVDGGTCCDMRSEYVASHDLTVWYVQNAYSATTGQGSVRLAVAVGRDALRSATASDWTRYVFDPADFGFPTDHWFDFPDVCANASWFYWTTNVFRRETDGSNTFISALRVRLDLADLQARRAVSFGSFRGDGGGNGGGSSYRLANGGDGTEMFWADYPNTTTLRVWKQDAAGANSFVDRPIAAFADTTATCIGPDNRNWMGNAVGRIRGAWGQAAEIGFLWTSNAQAGRPQPFLRVARLRVSDRTVIAEHDVWSSTLCFAHGAAEANTLGHVGLVVAVGSSTSFVRTSATIVDGYQAWGSGLVFTSMGAGAAGPTGNRWGDYLDVQRHAVEPRTFVGTGMHMTGPTTSTSRFAWFGRDDYAPNWVAVTVSSAGAATVPIELDVTDRLGLKDGVTGFSRSFSPRQGYTLTAPAAHTNGSARFVFDRWTHRATPTSQTILQPIGQLTLTIDDIGTGDDLAEARYIARHTLTVQSTNPSSGVAITVDTLDLDGNQNGSTAFTRDYRVGTVVTLTAPATVNGNPFRRWRRGPTETTAPALTLTVAADETLIADYWAHTAGTFTVYGAGCAGTGGNVPLHRGIGTPETGQTFEWGVRHSVGNTAGVLHLGTRAAPLSLGFLGMRPSCTLDVSPIALELPLSLDATGAARLAIVVPSVASNIGVRLATQATVLDPGVNTPIPAVQSNALETVLGGLR